MRHRILAVGNLSGFSRVTAHLFPAIAKNNDVIDIIDTKLSGFWNYYNYLYCFWKFPNPAKWLHPLHTIFGEGGISRYRLHTKYYNLKITEALQRKIQKVNKEYDIIFQASALPIRNKHGKPYCAFTDCTPKQVERDYPSWINFFSEKDKNIYEKIVNEAYSNASKIFTATDYARDSLINDYGINDEKAVTVYEGVNLKELPKFEKDYSNKTILFVGKGFDRKGGTTLIKAFKEVKKEMDDVKMIIVGLQPQIKVNDIIIKGYIDRKELLQLYKNASVFAMPSIYEPFGLVFLDAMAFKTPCVGSTSGGIPEIVEEGKTGFLVPPNDYKQLADKLILLLEDENIMKKMGEQGRKRVEKYFTWDLVVDRMTEQFNKIYP